LGEDKEEYERLDEWREIRVRRKRKSDSGAEVAKEGGEEGETTKFEGSERPVRGRKNNTKLVVIEVGCGDSLHSLRIEAELMIRENPSGTILDEPPLAVWSSARSSPRSALFFHSEIDTDQPQLLREDEARPCGHEDGFP
jgi:hypothetical protein